MTRKFSTLPSLNNLSFKTYLQARFDRVDAEYRKIMYGIAGDQRLVSLCNQTALSDKLANILDQLQRSVYFLGLASLLALLLN